MATATLRREVERIRLALAARRSAQSPILDRLRQEPFLVLTSARMTPDVWQTAFLASRAKRRLVLCSRQSGKSTVSAAVALWTALTVPRSLVLLLSPTLRQSAELFRKVMDLYGALGRPVPPAQESALRLELANGSRVVSLPGVEATVRSFSAVALIVVDEAARVPDPLYYSVRPMLAVSGGTLLCLSSAYAKQGWFYTSWTGEGPWERTKVTAYECPRISRAFLEEERLALGPRWFSMEYLCEFGEAIDSVFREEDITAAFDPTLEPLAIGV
jgi:hypothetical protein